MLTNAAAKLKISNYCRRENYNEFNLKRQFRSVRGDHPSSRCAVTGARDHIHSRLLQLTSRRIALPGVRLAGYRIAFSSPS
jgi:hypothetical protein